MDHLFFITLVLAVQAQQMRVQNGSLLLEIPGATLTLSAAGEDAASGAVSVASQQDLAAAIQNTISVVQPQVTADYILIYIIQSVLVAFVKLYHPELISGRGPGPRKFVGATGGIIIPAETEL